MTDTRPTEFFCEWCGVSEGENHYAACPALTQRPLPTKYHSGAYTVRIFDRLGRKLRDHDAQSYTEGRAIGEREQGAGSFALLRCVYNSREPHRTAVRDFEPGEA